MSNIATPRRTEPRDLVPGVFDHIIATVIASFLLTVTLVSFRPFTPEIEGSTATGGDIVNQLGFGSLGALSIASMLCFADRRVVATLIGPGWLLLLAFFGLSVLNALDPSSAMRSASFTLIGLAIVCAILIVPRSADGFSAMLVVAGCTVLVLSYAGIALLPALAKHTDGYLAGLWRGVFSHKNIAGPVMAAFSFAGFYLYRRGWRWIGAAIFLASIGFMLNTGSKTTAALVPAAILAVALPNMIGMRLVTPLLLALAVVGTALGTIGTAYIAPLTEFGAAYYEDPTFTGRTAIWQFGGEMLARRPWTGYGFESFWGTGYVLGEALPFDREWDVRNIVHGHNGYLDIALTMGIPALVVFVLVCIVRPMVDYMRVPLTRENVYLADFFMMVLTFTSLNAFLESFFFRRVDPVWFFFAFAVLGLRLTARFPIRAHDRADRL